MTQNHFTPGSESRIAWAAGRATCPECKRFGCRGQCGCPGLGVGPCEGCSKTPLADWSADCCDIIRDMRERSTPEGRAAQRKSYSDQLAGRSVAGVTWGECVAQVERVGCPHGVVAVARKPEARPALEGARTWWNVQRSGKPVALFTGGTGSGKTVAAAWLAIKFADSRKWWSGAPTGPEKHPLVWLEAESIARLSLLRDEDEALIERCGAAEFLIVDELPLAGGKAGLLALTQLLSRRIDSRKPLVITTNVAKSDEFREPLGAHFADRLMTAFVVRSGKDSYRGRAA